MVKIFCFKSPEQVDLFETDGREFMMQLVNCEVLHLLDITVWNFEQN